MNPLHIGIAGAGLAGRTLAWRLARSGCRVSLFDSRARDALDTASMTAAAMLSPLAELAVSDEAVFALGQRSMRLWPRWIAELAENGQQPVYFRQQGTLVVAHAPDQSSLAHFTRLLDHKLPDACRAQVRTLPYVTPPVLNALYNAARIVLHPSFYEGFGLPLIEAMAVGVPLVTSSVSSMPEVAGGAALLVNPADYGAIAAALAALDHDDPLRAKLVAEGRRRLGLFDWTDCARATLAVYREIA